MITEIDKYHGKISHFCCINYPLCFTVSGRKNRKSVNEQYQKCGERENSRKQLVSELHRHEPDTRLLTNTAVLGPQSNLID